MHMKNLVNMVFLHAFRCELCLKCRCMWLQVDVICNIDVLKASDIKSKLIYRNSNYSFGHQFYIEKDE